MKVLQLGPYPPPEGGINRNMLAIRDELFRIGHQCSIIATSKSTNNTSEKGVYRPRTPQDLVKLLKKLDFDILHLHVGGEITKRVLGLIAVCAFFGRGKSVLTIHSGGYPASKEGLAAKKKSIRGLIFRQFEKIISVNPLIAEVFQKYGISEERLEVVYPFAQINPDSAIEIPGDLARFAEKHSPFLLTVCLLEDTYDLFMQIEAMEKVLENLPSAGLMIVGSGTLENELRKAISSKKYAERIFLAGDVEHKITLHLIKKADIVLRTTKFDGDAISVREALFLETPVIATDNAMRPSGVYLIPMGDAAALSAGIKTLSKDGKKIKTEKPDDRSNIAEILKIYTEVLAANSKNANRRNSRQTEKKGLI